MQICCFIEAISPCFDTGIHGQVGVSWYQSPVDMEKQLYIAGTYKRDG